jgi:hypothetical protein
MANKKPFDAFLIELCRFQAAEVEKMGQKLAELSEKVAKLQQELFDLQVREALIGPITASRSTSLGHTKEFVRVDPSPSDVADGSRFPVNVPLHVLSDGINESPCDGMVGSLWATLHQGEVADEVVGEPDIGCSTVSIDASDHYS